MMDKLPFWKVQSIGNHFPLVHLSDVQALFERRREVGGPEAGTIDTLLSKIAVALCRERFGVGGDGLLAVGREGESLRLRMFNPDGTEDFCGNGLRCAAVHAHGLGWVGEHFTILHLDREVETFVQPGGRVATVIGKADYSPEKVPVSGPELFDSTVWSGMDSGLPLSLFGSALTTGSTHTVIPTMALPDDDSFRSVSAKIEVDPKFPNRTSVIWSRVVSPMKLEIRIWERGVGETLGCGTGSSAAAVDYLRRRHGGGTVEVVNPGGTVRVTAASWEAPITVEGIAYEVFSGEASPDLEV